MLPLGHFPHIVIVLLQMYELSPQKSANVKKKDQGYSLTQNKNRSTNEETQVWYSFLRWL